MHRLGTGTLLLLSAILVSGCGPREAPHLYIYCSETFWYVMQEEALAFNKIYGFQVILIPIRAERTINKGEYSIEIGTENRPLSRWQSRPDRLAEQRAADTLHHINPDIESQLERIDEESFGDLFLSDSRRQLAKLQQTALSVNEFVVCYLTLTMIVPEGNPYRFRSAKDVLDSNRRLGIVDPSLDGLGESSWEMLGKIVPGGESAIPRDLVRFHERQYDLLEALEQESIDAALVWDATSLTSFLLEKYADEYNALYENDLREAARRLNREELQRIRRRIAEQIIDENSFAETVPLSQNPNERSVVAVHLVPLSSTTNYGFCERFTDFLRSKQGKDILQRFGFSTD